MTGTLQRPRGGRGGEVVAEGGIRGLNAPFVRCRLFGQMRHKIRHVLTNDPEMEMNGSIDSLQTIVQTMANVTTWRIEIETANEPKSYEYMSGPDTMRDMREFRFNGAGMEGRRLDGVSDWYEFIPGATKAAGGGCGAAASSQTAKRKRNPKSVAGRNVRRRRSDNKENTPPAASVGAAASAAAMSDDGDDEFAFGDRRPTADDHQPTAPLPPFDLWAAVANVLPPLPPLPSLPPFAVPSLSSSSTPSSAPSVVTAPAAAGATDVRSPLTVITDNCSGAAAAAGADIAAPKESVRQTITVGLTFRARVKSVHYCPPTDSDPTTGTVDVTAKKERLAAAPLPLRDPPVSTTNPTTNNTLAPPHQRPGTPSSPFKPSALTLLR
jgi:hypothetical protein